MSKNERGNLEAMIAATESTIKQLRDELSAYRKDLMVLDKKDGIVASCGTVAKGPWKGQKIEIGETEFEKLVKIAEKEIGERGTPQAPPAEDIEISIDRISDDDLLGYLIFAKDNGCTDILEEGKTLVRDRIVNNKTVEIYIGEELGKNDQDGPDCQG